jgi:hypothetical protein
VLIKPPVVRPLSRGCHHLLFKSMSSGYVYQSVTVRNRLIPPA